MPVRPTLEQRIAWHVAHAAACACRPMPAAIAAALQQGGRAPSATKARKQADGPRSDQPVDAPRSRKEADAPRYFATPARFRTWFERNAAHATYLVVGFYKRDSGRSSITWPESVDEALCFGWIDGVRKSVDGERYTIRFSPRRAASTWSAINIARVAELERAGRMTEAGRAAFERRREDRSPRYSHEASRAAAFTPQEQTQFERQRAAWKFFSTQAPSYQRMATWWVVSAKRPETRERRLVRLIAVSQDGRRL
jgi:uncharacterized protein YdeI (YjbR/CyaY-like superfamily)